MTQGWMMGRAFLAAGDRMLCFTLKDLLHFFFFFFKCPFILWCLLLPGWAAGREGVLRGLVFGKGNFLPVVPRDICSNPWFARHPQLESIPPCVPVAPLPPPMPVFLF